MKEKLHKAYLISSCIVVVESFYALTKFKTLGAYMGFVAVLLVLAAVETQFEESRLVKVKAKKR